jgi:DNA ligase-1
MKEDIMQEVFSILRKIESNRSRNVKKAILIDNSGNELLRKYLYYAFNDRMVYGIGTKSLKLKNKPVAPTTSTTQRPLFGNSVTTGRMCSFKDIFQLLDELVKHPFGSAQDVMWVNTFLSECDEEAYYWYSKLITKDVKIGCTASTINEVWDGYIPVFEVMLAHPYKNYSDKIQGEFQLQQKINGFRFITVLHPDGSFNFFTRNGLELFEFPEIESELKGIVRLMSDKAIVLDGELQAKNSFNDTQKMIMKHGPKTDVIYHVFDWLFQDEFEVGKSKNGLFYRYDSMQYIVPNTAHIIVEPELYRGSDIAAVTKWFNYAKTQKWEGIMLKLNTPYVRERTSNMLKIKEFESIDLRVLRVNEHKNGGMLGSVTVDYDGVEVDVGSGFSEPDRIKFWNDQNLIIDQVIEIQYFEETTNKEGKPSLQFPVFKCIRYDK